MRKNLIKTLGDKLMELSAIYHRPESEFAYLYKDKKLHIRIRTKKGDIESINLYYGDPFIFMEEFYQDTKEMAKITSDALFDYWKVEASVDFARIQYLFELKDTEGQSILYGDKGCVENSLENLHAIGNGFKLPYLHEIDACQVPDWVSNTVWYQIFPERFANGNARLNPDGTLDWDSSITPNSDDFFGGDLQGIIDHLDYLQDLGITGLYLCPIFESTSNHKYNTTDYFEIDRHFGDKETFRELVEQAHQRGMKIMLDAVFNHIGSQSLQWQDVVTFKVKNITQSIRTKDNMLIKMDIINQLELIAKNVICDNESKTDLPLYKILPFEYRLYEITIIDKQNQHHTYGVTEDYNSYRSTRDFDDFKILYN